MAPKKKSLEVVPVTTTNSADGLIEKAIASNTPVDVMERLLAMRTQVKAEQAKEAFTSAMASFQAECPTIVKTKEVKTRGGVVAYKYAPIESIVSQVKEPLKNNGFSYTTQIDITEKGVKATVKVTHIQGHSEETSMEVPLGNKTEIMSMSQVTAAASTFAKRYAFCNAFGILTGDEDNDGADFDKTPVPAKAIPTVVYDAEDTEVVDSQMPWHKSKDLPIDPLEQRKRIFALLKGLGVDITDGKACKEYVADNTFLELVEPNYKEIIRLLEK